MDGKTLRGAVWLRLLLVVVCLLVPASQPAGGYTHLQERGSSAQTDWNGLLNSTRGADQAASVDHVVGRGEGLGAILAGYNVNRKGVAAWCAAAATRTNLRRLAPGTRITLTFAGGELAGLHVLVGDEKILRVSGTTASGLEAALEPVPARTRIAGARGTVETSFYKAAQQAGIPETVISGMADVLGWKIDFSNDARPGDHFRVLYEHRAAPDGTPLKPGRILAVEYEGARRSAAAFFYQGPDGKDTYLGADGEPLESAFLRYPLEFTRISSTFTNSRFHPILKRRRPHHAVDFAAPSGTPVRSIGAGTILFAGRRGGLGRHIRVDHGNGLVSTYSHLRSIRRGIHRGVRVERGQMIGRVGQSGLATGPHLHFAVYRRGHYINPLKLTPPVVSVRVDHEKFAAMQISLAERMKRIPGNYPAMPSTPPIALSAVAQACQVGPVALTL